MNFILFLYLKKSSCMSIYYRQKIGATLQFFKKQNTFKLDIFVYFKVRDEAIKGFWFYYSFFPTRYFIPSKHSNLKTKQNKHHPILQMQAGLRIIAKINHILTRQQ